MDDDQPPPFCQYFARCPRPPSNSLSWPRASYFTLLIGCLTKMQRRYTSACAHTADDDAAGEAAQTPASA